MASRQDKEWEIAMNKESDSLKQYQTSDKVPIKTARPNKAVISSRFVFKQNAVGLYK